jgi:hypothetical protein
MSRKDLYEPRSIRLQFEGRIVDSGEKTRGLFVMSRKALCHLDPPQINARVHLLEPFFRPWGAHLFLPLFLGFPLFSMKKRVRPYWNSFPAAGVWHLFGHYAPKAPHAFIWGGANYL